MAKFALLIAALLLAAPSRSARAADADELCTIGWTLLIPSALAPQLAATVITLSGGTPNREDLHFYNTFMIPAVGPAITGIRIMESHPLTVLVGGFLCLLSGVQTVALTMMIAGHAKGGTLKLCRHAEPRRGPRGPRVAVSPTGVAIWGVF